MAVEPTYETVARVDSDRTWVRLVDQAAADRETSIAVHAVRHMFSAMDEKGFRFFGLHTEDGLSLATVMVPGTSGEMLVGGGMPGGSINTIVAGPGNTTPFPDQDDAFEVLAQATGYRLGPEHCAYHQPGNTLAYRVEGSSRFDAYRDRVPASGTPRP